jgi:hypothetical protein
MSRANQHLRTDLQRLRGGDLAPPLPGSFGQDPRALRPERLRWLAAGCNARLAKSLAPAKIAAFPAVLRPIAPHFFPTAARAEAMVGAVPPFSDPQPPEGAMR